MSVVNNQNGLFPIAGTDNPNKKLDVLLLHGLGGDAFSTWKYENEEAYFWPKAVLSDCPDIAVWTIGYGASASGWIEDVMSMEDRAENLLNQLVLKGIGKQAFTLITHSMGGLIAKYMLTQAAQSNNTNYQEIAKNCQGVVFLAVPHNGSGWSNILDYARILVRGNEIVRQLAKDSAALRQLDKNFRQLNERLHLACYAFFETKEVRIQKKVFGLLPISKGIQIVSESSASSSFLTEPAIPMDDDHLSICKLHSKDDQLYGNMVRIIKMFLAAQTIAAPTEQTPQSTPEPSTPTLPFQASPATSNYPLKPKQAISTPPQASQESSTNMSTIQAKMAAMTAARNQQRLELLWSQLAALQQAYDLETRSEEKIRLQFRIEEKQADIDQLTENL